ncbi:MAG: hypothetical protein WCP10_00160 [Desulfuromonadales bacterium]
MKMSIVLLVLVVCMGGCAQNHYNVPAENFADRVKVLGVAPIFVDADSDIKHPQKDQLVQLVAEMNRKYESQLVRKLKSTGNFYTVALLDGDPARIFGELLFRRERRDDATIQYNKYFWKNDELRSYMQKNNLDAVMLLTVNGLTKFDKVFSGTLLASQESDYNFLTITGQILDINSTVLWEYPNFRSRLLTYYPLINLQYPDFSESEANLTQKADIKFKNLDGIRRTLEKKRKDWMQRETLEPETYSWHFDEMVKLIKYDVSGESRPASAPVVKAPPAPAAPPVPQNVQQPPPAQPQPEQQKTPVVSAPDVKPAPAAVEIAPAVPQQDQTGAGGTTSLRPDEIAPAPGSPR